MGGGPTGLSLALGLARLQIPSILLEKNSKTSDKSKAPGIHIRTREIFSMWGIEEEFLEAGNLKQAVDVFSPVNDRVLLSVDFRELEREASRPGILVLEQGETESILCRAVRDTALCELRFNTEAIALAVGKEKISLTVSKPGDDKEEITAAYVIGCDGAGSFIRQALQLPFKGFTYSIEAILADVWINDSRDELPWPRFYNGTSVTLALKLKKSLWRIIRLEPGKPNRDKEISKAEIAPRVQEVLGEGEFQLEWANPFRIHRRSSPRFRKGRVLLAGDAAHVHSPAGGQGMNAGIQDAHNLAWKLAAILQGKDEENLLNSYEEERMRVVVKKVSRYTNFVTRIFLQSPKQFRRGSFFIVRRLLTIPALRKKFLRRTSMINGVYSNSVILPSSNKAAGRRLPNVRLKSTSDTSIRLYELLKYRAVLLKINTQEEVELPDPVEIVTIGRGNYVDSSGLLQDIVGGREGWILVRPDAHIAWAGNDRRKLEKMVKNGRV